MALCHLKDCLVYASLLECSGISQGRDLELLFARFGGQFFALPKSELICFFHCEKCIRPPFLYTLRHP